MKRFLAVLVAMVIIASFSSVAWAYSFDSVSSVYELNKFCTKIGDEYRYEVDISYYLETHTVTEEEKQKIFTSYNTYRSALENPSKTIMVRTAPSGSNYFIIYICNTSELRRSVTSPYVCIFGKFDVLNVTLNTKGETTSLSASSYDSYNFTSWSGTTFFVQNPVHPPNNNLSSNSIHEVKDPVNFNLVFTNMDNFTSRNLTINYLYSENNPAADSVTQEIVPGEEYSIPSPEISGYTPSIPIVSGTMPEEDLTIDVYYSKSFYNLTVKYQYADGTKAAEDTLLQYPSGFVYDVPIPQIDGYQPDKSSVAGTMPEGPVTEIVTYTAIPYTLTVNYQYADGSQAAESHQEQLTVGTHYSVPSPTIEGFHPNQTSVTGIMPAADVMSTVTYRKDSGGSGGTGPAGPGEGGESGGETGGGSGDGGDSGDDPFTPVLPPFSGNDPFIVPDVPEYSGYDPFTVPKIPGYSGYDPFIVPKIPAFSGYDPFSKPDNWGES